MFGYQEILIISAIVAGVLVLPRLVKPPRQAPRIVRSKKLLPGTRRLAIAASVIYPFIVVAVMQPGRDEVITFAYVGLGPVLLGWLLYWVFRGFKRG